MRKNVKLTFVIGCVIILLLPILFFNRQENAISEIDNKMLTENPLKKNKSEVEDLSQALEDYVSERIGFRDEMILAYTVANDRLFGEMVHPTYMYGKDGYVFFKAHAPHKYSEFEVDFENMVTIIQHYCDERGIPFVFVFEPEKASIYSDKLPVGYHYDNQWVTTLINKLKNNGVNCVDNSVVMKNCRANGLQVFNVKYNAGHWNDLGAYYGVNSVLENLKQFLDDIHVNTLDEFEITQKLETSLPVSKFPINEYEPIFSLKNRDSIHNLADQYSSEISLTVPFTYFCYYGNDNRNVRLLIFQGSYTNGMGYKFFMNSFNEYIGVHDYQNILNFQYYVNIFHPDCIVFEAAEYTFTNRYFNQKKMEQFKLNPLFSNFDDYHLETIFADPEITHGDALTTITINPGVEPLDYAYMEMNGEIYDCSTIENNNGFSVTCLSQEFDPSDLKFYFIDDSSQTKYYASYHHGE